MLFWNAFECPWCGAEVPIGIMSLVARCDCGAWYNDCFGSEPRIAGWHKELDEVIG